MFMKKNVYGSILKYKDVGGTGEYLTVAEKFTNDKQTLLDNVKGLSYRDGGEQSALIEGLCQALDVTPTFNFFFLFKTYQKKIQLNFHSCLITMLKKKK